MPGTHHKQALAEFLGLPEAEIESGPPGVFHPKARGPNGVLIPLDLHWVYTAEEEKGARDRDEIHNSLQDERNIEGVTYRIFGKG